ncbi:MAG TPA: riboflavin synthase [Solirubrobacteraceae bacterium]|nr:riboflavin synthase [Solirubrobacteraceae bacterium]
MFTGLIADRGRVSALRTSADGATVAVQAALATELAPGDSVALNGVCLTVRSSDEEAFTADVVHETLSRTNLGQLTGGAPVNLELPVRAGAPLGGHIVQGHVDGLGTVTASRPDGLATVMTVSADPELLRYVVEKGSIAVDGVSLTVARVDDSGFDVSLIPETLERTTLSNAAAGARVNLEVDLLAKYVEKLALVNHIRETAAQTTGGVR